MRSKLFAGYVAFMALAIVSYTFAPDQIWVRVGWQVAVGWLAAGAAVVGVRRYRPEGASAWLLFAAGVFLNSTGILVEQIVHLVSPDSDAYPTWADAFWLALYPCLVAGMFVLNRHRTGAGKRDTAAMLDSTTITAGLGLLSWVFVIRPSVGAGGMSVLGQATVVAYPVGDVVVLAMIVRLLLGGGARMPALRLLLGSMLTFLLGDVLWVVWSQTVGLELTGIGLNLMQMIFLVAFALVGAGALHPSLRETGQQVPSREARLSPALLISLTVAALIAPAVLVAQAAHGKVIDGVAIAVSSTVLFSLVVTRLAGVLRRVELQSKQLRALATADALTGLPNRRAWGTELPTALERARRDAVPLAVCMIDLDYFKKFNDEFGHPAGDRLLKGAAAGWKEQVRAVDFLARYGGEEFILLLPNASLEEACQVVERLRPATPAGQTFSSGLALWDGTETSDELVSRADKALYVAKQGGRNRTAVAEDIVSPLA